MRIAYLGIALAIMLNFFGTPKSYANEFTDRVDRLLKEGQITPEEARKMLRGHIEEEIGKGPRIEDLIKQSEGLQATQFPRFGVKKCAPHEKGCTIM